MSAPRVALVTGASSGIGRAVAARLASAGHRVHAAARWSDPSGPPDHGVVPLTMDVRDDEQVRAGVAGVVAAEGGLDVVVNAAGFGIAGALEDTTTEEAWAQLDTNLLGVHRVTRAALPHLRVSRGHLVTVSSIAGLVAVPFQGMYTASKYALEGYTEALRLEVAPFGVRVVLVEPGDIATGFTAARVVTDAADSPGSPYRDRFAPALSTMVADETGGSAADVVASTVVSAVNDARPRLRYTVGPAEERLFAQLRRVLPFSVVERVVRSHYAG